jgi:hypothetical protein
MSRMPVRVNWDCSHWLYPSKQCKAASALRHYWQEEFAVCVTAWVLYVWQVTVCSTCNEHRKQPHLTRRRPLMPVVQARLQHAPTRKRNRHDATLEMLLLSAA